jgi:hypothetical protein
MRTEAFALIVMATFAAPVGAQVSPLFVIPTESSANASISPSTPLRVLLTVHDPAKLAASLGINPPAGSGSFEYTVGAYPQVVGPANRTWLEPTFVIDFDQPEFAPLLAEIVTIDGASHDLFRPEGFAYPRAVDDFVARVERGDG